LKPVPSPTDAVAGSDGAGRRATEGRDGNLEAAGLAAASMAANLASVVATLVFTRLLGTEGYGSLAALLNLSVILYVPGAALQVAVARAGALGALGGRAEQAAALAHWVRRVLIALSALALVAGLARAQLAAVLDVEEEWAAAAVPVTAGVLLLVSLQRGLLQAEGAYRAVGLSILIEAVGRVCAGTALVLAGLGVSGAYAATPASLAVCALALAVTLRRRLGSPAPDVPVYPISALARGAATPIVALIAVAVLQNVDVILARHVLPEELAGAYAAATVAAKALVWIAVGVGMWLLPEAVRRAAAGGDARLVLARAFAVIGVVAAPALAIFALAPRTVMRIAFGPGYEAGGEVLLALGAAYSLLAAAYLSVQFLLGLGRRRFVVALGLAAAAEPVVLAGADSLYAFAVIVLVLQAATAAALVTMALRRRHAVAPPPARSPLAAAQGA
jgi:O-antigen/teichoic acid export membrane protein